MSRRLTAINRAKVGQGIKAQSLDPSKYSFFFKQLYF